MSIDMATAGGYGKVVSPLMTEADKAREAKIRLARKKLQQFQRKKQTESASGSQEDISHNTVEMHHEPAHHLQVRPSANIVYSSLWIL